MQYKVPQNVDIEDRVIGSLTLRQFMILLVALGLDIFLFFLIPSFIRFAFWLLAFLITGLAIIVGFVKYGDQNLEVFLLSALKTIQLPNLRVWRKETTAEEHRVEEVKPVNQTERKKKSLEDVRGNLEQLAELVDSGGTRDFQAGERMVGVEKSMPEDSGTPDILAKSEEAQPRIDSMINKAKAPTREPLISEVASVDPSRDFNYSKIKKF